MDGPPQLLAEDVARYSWHHSIDLGNGVVTPGHKPTWLHEQEANAFFDHVDLAGATVIDIGAWNGFYSFEAKRRGARRVVAADSYVWTDPAFRGREAFELARAALGIDVEALEIDLMDMSVERQGDFDVVLFAGVLYHLKDPIKGLEIAASLACELIIVETHIDLMFLDRPAMAFYPGKELANDDTNWWGPNLPCVIAMLQELGFTAIDTSQVSPQRGILHAWRSLTRRQGDPKLSIPLNLRRAKLRAAWRLVREAMGLRGPATPISSL